MIQRMRPVVSLLFPCALVSLMVLSGCGGQASLHNIVNPLGGVCTPSSVQPCAGITPKFLVAVDSGTAGSNVTVFPINSTTGALGAAVVGSPFNMGLTNGFNLVVHPNGHWVYAPDSNDGSIHAFNVNEITGVATVIGSVINESGSFYQPNGNTDSGTTVLAISPDGQYLYSANNDATVGQYLISQTSGALTPIGAGNLNIGACDTGAIIASLTNVYVTDTCGSSGPWNVYSMSIGANGALSSPASVPVTNVYTWLWSITLSPNGKFLYTGDEGGDAQIFAYSVGTNGALTSIAATNDPAFFNTNSSAPKANTLEQFFDPNSSDCRDFAFSPDGKFLYWTDDDEFLHVLTSDATSGLLDQPNFSPYQSNAADGQIVVDMTGQFIYFGGGGNGGGVYAYTRDQTTGAATLIGSSFTATANNNTMGVGIVRERYPSTPTN